MFLVRRFQVEGLFFIESVVFFGSPEWEVEPDRNPFAYEQNAERHDDDNVRENEVTKEIGKQHNTTKMGTYVELIL